MTIDVFGLGALNRDYLYRVPEILVDGETVVESVTVTSGGSAANTCRALAQWGVRTGFIGVVGDDSDGQAMLADLRASGVEVAGVVVKPQARTGKVIGLVDPQGRRSLYVDPGANSRLSQDDIDPMALAQVRLLHLASFVDLAQLQLQEWLVGELPTGGAEPGQIGGPLAAPLISFSPGQIYTRLGRERLSSILEHTGVLFLNRSEAQALGGADKLRTSGCDIVVETLGPHGSRVTHPGGHFHTPAFPASVVDTTGAGDAFAAGFLLGWLQKRPLETCARWGSWTASRVIQAPGANSQLPTLEELEVSS